MPKKGFEKSLHVIITIVVLLVVALALITLVTNNLIKTDRNITPTEDEAACNTWKQIACGPGDAVIKKHPGIPGCEISCADK